MDKQPHRAAVKNALKEMSRVAEESIVPQMRKSAFVIASADGSTNIDVWMALQIGFAIMFGKPLIVMVTDDFNLPPRLAAITDEVVRVPSLRGRESRKVLEAAISRLLVKLENRASNAAGVYDCVSYHASRAKNKK